MFIATLALRECLPDTGSVDKTLGETRLKRAIYLFVAAGVIFRSEIALLLATQLLASLAQSRISLQATIMTGLQSALVALAISVPIDSYFWQKPIWPELAGFYFNAIQGKSADWGTSPYGYYFLNLLPKLLLNPLILTLLIPLSFNLPSTRFPAGSLTVPSILFIALYSLQPHKESRFIIYVVPPLTAAASLSASYIWTRRSKTLLYRLASLLLAASVFASFAASTVMLLISSLNYPGGEALLQLHTYMHNHPDLRYPSDFKEANEIRIHMDVLSCMTGITQFQQYHRTADCEVEPRRKNGNLPLIGGRETCVFYDKTEEEEGLLESSFWDRFDYALMEEPGKAIGAWDVVGTVYAYAGIEILRPGDSSGFEEGLEKVYAANNLTKVESGEDVAPDSDDVQEAVEDGVRLDVGNKVSGVDALNLKKLSYFGIYTWVRESVRLVTGGWWIGPKMEPKLRILKRIKDPSH
jgi:alpha-1,6-mannosyltransferase